MGAGVLHLAPLLVTSAVKVKQQRHAGESLSAHLPGD